MPPAIPRPAGDPDRFDPATFDAERFAAGRAAADGSGFTPGEPLDWARDPDRFDAGPEEPVLALDPRLDPDRYPAVEPTLPALLGTADDAPRDTWAWALGLVSVFAFLALVSIVFSTIEP